MFKQSRVNSKPFDVVYPEPFDYAQDKLRRRAQGGAVNSQQSPDGATGIDITSALGKQGNFVKILGVLPVARQ